MPNIYLVGFMGAGKSLVGEALAEGLSYGFLDLDEHLVQRLGRPIREVFEVLGEDRFRAAEREELSRCTTLADTVIATGGGAFCSSANRDIIHSGGGRSVFLDLPWNVLAERLGGDQSERPKFAGIEAARRLYEERRPHYQQATWTVELDGSEPPEAVAGRILEVLAGAACAT
jgi:shikimate kinase